MTGERGQAAVEAIAGTVVIAVATLAIWQVVLVLAAASAAQAEARRDALDAPADGTLRRVTRTRRIDGYAPWLPAATVGATAATR